MILGPSMMLSIHLSEGEYVEYQVAEVYHPVWSCNARFGGVVTAWPMKHVTGLITRLANGKFNSLSCRLLFSPTSTSEQ